MNKGAIFCLTVYDGVTHNGGLKCSWSIEIGRKNCLASMSASSRSSGVINVLGLRDKLGLHAVTCDKLFNSRKHAEIWRISRLTFIVLESYRTCFTLEIELPFTFSSLRPTLRGNILFID